MNPSFIAFIHDLDGADVVDKIRDAYKPPYIRTYDLAEGQLTLFTWAETGGIANGEGAFLVTLDKSRCLADVPISFDHFDTNGVDGGLLQHAKQYQSYLYLDDRRRAVLWTDHVGVSKIFHTKVGACRIFSDDLAVFSLLDLNLDHGMIASFLANGFMLDQHTLYDGVRSLAPASLAIPTPENLNERLYWNFEPGVDPSPDIDSVGSRLWARIHTAVLTHTADNDIVLPLSGGNDSTCLLGILSQAGRRVTAFTYVNGTPQRGSDAEVAQRQAQQAGVEHEIIRIDDTSLIEILQTNLAAGQVMRHVSYEIVAYARAAAIAESEGRRPMFCMGDHSFGWNIYRLNNGNDLLGAVEVKSANCLSSLEPVLGSACVDVLQAALESSYLQFLEKMPSRSDPEDIKDWLYLAVRHSMNLIPLRVYSAGRYLPFCCPFLDLAVLDTMRQVPTKYRVEKQLFKNVIRRQLPQLFAVPRAYFDQTEVDLGRMVRREEAQLREYLSGLKTGIPGVMAPEDLRKLFNVVIEQQDVLKSPGSGLHAAKKAVREAIRAAASRGVIPSSWQAVLRRRTFNKFHDGPEPEKLFLRALHLSMAFQQLETR